MGDPLVDLRKHFISRYYSTGARVFDCAGNNAIWDKIGVSEYVGYDYEAAGEAGLELMFNDVHFDIVDIGGKDPWGIYADVLAGFTGRPVTIFLSIPRSALRMKDGLTRFVWERVGIPFDWSRWNGPALDGWVLRAGLSYFEERNFIAEDAMAVRFFGKPFPWRYNHVGVKLLPR
jgi:hypothetical protein